MWPFDGSAAQFATKEVKWPGGPMKTIWCLHDKGAINPKYVNVTAATTMVEKETMSVVLNMDHNKVYTMFNSFVCVYVYI